MDKLTLMVECAQHAAPMALLLHQGSTRRYHPECVEYSMVVRQLLPTGRMVVQNACSWHTCDHCGKRF